MRYQILQPLTVKTGRGNIELLPGQVVILPQDKADYLLSQGKVRPSDMEIMKSEYSAFSLWLDEIHLKHDIDYIIDIEHCYPSAHKAIQNAIITMDTHMRAGNLQDFRQAMMRLKSSYIATVRTDALTTNTPVDLTMTNINQHRRRILTHVTC